MATRAIARIGDISNHDSAAIVSSNQDGTVFCEGKEVAVNGAKLATHYSDPTHPLPSITSNLATKLFINKKAVVLVGSIATCGAAIVSGASKTFGS